MELTNDDCIIGGREVKVKVTREEN